MDETNANPPAGKSGGQSTNEKEESPMKDVKKTDTRAQGGAKMDGGESTPGKEVREDEGLLSPEQVQSPFSHEDSDGRGRTTQEETPPEDVVWYYFWGQPYRSQMPDGYEGEYVHFPPDWDDDEIIKGECELWVQRFVGPTPTGYRFGFDRREPPPDVASKMVQKYLDKIAEITDEVRRLIPFVNRTEICPECGAYMRFTIVHPDRWNKDRHRYEFAERQWACAQCGKMVPYGEMSAL